MPWSARGSVLRPCDGMKMTRSGARKFVLGIHAQTAFRFRTVVIQRRAANGHRWVAVRTARLTIFRAAATEWTSTAVFRLRVRHGTMIRAFFARAQVVPAYYGPAWTRALRA
jgi:hypothetical protein